METSVIKQLMMPEVQDFLAAHAKDDEREIVLRKRTVGGISGAILAQQIAGRRKAKERLPSFSTHSAIIYPPSINLEQCSSEATAITKTLVIKTCLGNTDIENGADLTGGFGIDSLFLSRVSNKFHYSDPDADLGSIAKHNHRVMGALNIIYHTQTAEDFIKDNPEQFSFIFIDPSRRKDHKKVFYLSDCEPDAASLLPDLFGKTDLVLIKASPLLDLQQGISELNNIEKIIILAVKNECREVLFLCHHGFSAEPAIDCVHLYPSGEIKETFSFKASDERSVVSNFSDPLHYIYEPNAAILKAGAFKLVGEQFGLSKIQQHTHLYTSESLVHNFPGRIFEIEEVHPDLHKAEKYFPSSKANIITRNYPLSPEALKKKFKLNDGGEKYLIGFSGRDQKFTITAHRAN